MSRHHARGGASRRAFRPTLDGRLESRALLSRAGGLLPPFQQRANGRPGRFAGNMTGRTPVAHIQTANGGRSVQVTTADGERFQISLTSALEPTTTQTQQQTTTTNQTGTTFPQITAGTVRARPMAGGRVALILDGTTAESELTINPVLQSPVVGGAHDFGVGLAAKDQLLNIGSIVVTSGKINRIEGYRTAVLSGPIEVGGTTRVDRIAFAALEPGAAISVGGSLDTLDVITSITLDGGPGISVGQDLNWLNVGQDVTLTGGSSIVVGRDIGLTPQPAKGSATGGQGALITGNLGIGPGSSLTIGRSLDAPFIVNGSVIGTSRISVPQGGQNFFARGGFSPT